jgi:SAM-dependent MidA family methyltransferase
MCSVPQGANPLTEIIRAEIVEGGPMPFARFMALALYHPEFGYYEKDTGQVGRRGDFVTSVSVGAVFGQLLAFRFAKWLRAIAGPVRIAEAGAHDGSLAGDILEWLAANDEPLFERLTYSITEPSAKRRSWQAKRLAKFAGQVEWHDSPADAPEIRGVIFSNELLDAFPSHRIGWDAAKRDWFEWAVSWRDGGFRWERRVLAAVAPDLAKRVARRVAGSVHHRAVAASQRVVARRRRQVDRREVGRTRLRSRPERLARCKSAGRNRARLPRPKTC